MAIMIKCLCFENVRSGSIASAICTLVYSAFVMSLAARQLWLLDAIQGASYLLDGVVAIYAVTVAFFSLIIISSMLTLVGVSRDQRGFLVPYMVVMPLLILLQGAWCILLIIGLTTVASSYIDYHSLYVAEGTTVGVVQLILAILLTALDVLCFFCVVSQYQELRDGRGRRQDVMATSTVVTTTSVVGGAVITAQQTVAPQGNVGPSPAYNEYPGHTSYSRLQEYPPCYPPQHGFIPQQSLPPQPGDTPKY
ncbi:uncharacterized protein LOC110984085 isoform X2 [Acanthaster planci]|uniref:Uncharacterized protein LOC110984085 isoform X2 n=1 Tax=Acanthaster planci TaxID=133434 RepID=A0A8B7Z8J7_ACAPL|nr:uncharacterized protein LOC110984085 isoform X2 [Acanthaster planci]